MNCLTFFISIVVMIAAVSATDYCSPNICDKGETHIACGHNHKFDPSCPSDANMVAITGSLQKVLVHAHNVKRNIIAGGGDANHKRATRMATMDWDDELAKLAALNVMQCKMSHNECHNTDSFKYAGQNLAWMTFHGAVNHENMLNKAVEMWYAEVKNSKQSYIDSFPEVQIKPAIGHFTVMMADRNTRVGCAASTYPPKGETYTAYLVACNYATTNMQTYPIYKSGSKAASDCLTGKNGQYPNLCSAAEQYAVNKWSRS